MKTQKRSTKTEPICVGSDLIDNVCLRVWLEYKLTVSREEAVKLAMLTVAHELRCEEPSPQLAHAIIHIECAREVLHKTAAGNEV